MLLQELTSFLTPQSTWSKLMKFMWVNPVATATGRRGHGPKLVQRETKQRILFFWTQMRNHNNDAMTAEGRAEGQKETSRFIAESLDRASAVAKPTYGFSNYMRVKYFFHYLCQV